MQFTPYLNFDGNCAEAFAFYAKLFGGVIAYQSTFGEIPASADMPPMPESAKNRIMHVQLQIKEQSLMGSDSMPGAEATRSEEHTSELQSLMRISYAVFCLKKKTKNTHNRH